MRGFHMKHTFIQRLGLAYLLALGAQIVAVPHIQQIRVTQQTGSSCGYHSVYNAQAVETLALAGRPLTAASIVQEAGQYRNFIQRDAILGDIIIDLANQLGIENLYCINGGNGLAFGGSSQNAQDGHLFLNDVATQRQHAQLMIGHFVVNTGGHWVVFSVIKNPGQEATVLYMDSINTPLSHNRVAQTVGNALLARLGGRVNAPAAERNAGKQRGGRAQGNFNGKRSMDRNRRSDDNFNQSDYEQKYEQEDTAQDTQTQETPKSTGFSYKTYIAVALVCLVIGFSSK